MSVSEPSAVDGSIPATTTDLIDERVASLSLADKVELLTGADNWGTRAVPSIGLRGMVLSDGPAGVRGVVWDERDPSVSLPSATALAATWDPELIEDVGALMAAEADRKGVDVVLGPTINLHRSPLGGRHFECFSEDPLLTARIGAAFVRSLQRRGVGGTPKHFVGNDSETDRRTYDARIGERVLRELYLLPFELICRDAQPWVVMAAYNAVNGATMTENPLLEDPLKREWGFDGVVVSDWSATRSTVAAGRAALDLAMPGPDSPLDGLVEAVRDGRVPESAIDDKVRRILRLAARVGKLDGVELEARSAEPFAEDSSSRLARQVAAASMVLLRNDGVLPLDPRALQHVAVIGPNALAGRPQGGGSALVFPRHTVGPLDGLREALPADVELTYRLGADTDAGLVPFDRNRSVDPVTGRPGVRERFLDADGTVLHDEWRGTARLILQGEERLRRSTRIELLARYTAEVTGTYRFGSACIGDTELIVDGRSVLREDVAPTETDDAASLLAPPQRRYELHLDEGQTVELTLVHRHPPGTMLAGISLGLDLPSLPPEQEFAAAVDLAGTADVAVVVVGTTERVESEGFDRPSLALPGRQDELVSAVAAVNPRTVVVVNAGSPVEMPWRDEVAAVLVSWFPGQEFGTSLADVLLGLTEPGGRLPTTWPATEADVPVHDTTPRDDGTLPYDEGLHIGYRAWARIDAAPAYAFGHGLGYTTWELGVPEVPTEPIDVDAADRPGAIEVGVTAHNTGARRGRDVVQVYLSRPDSAVERPALWLAGFAGVEADAGTSTTVAVTLEPRAFAHWDGAGWTVEPGTFVVHVGRSATDLLPPVELTVA